MPSWVGNGADLRREQRKQIALQGFIYPMPTWVGNGADVCRERRKQIALQGFT